MILMVCTIIIIVVVFITVTLVVIVIIPITRQLFGIAKKVMIVVIMRIVGVDGCNDVSMHVWMKDGLWRCHSCSKHFRNNCSNDPGLHDYHENTGKGFILHIISKEQHMVWPPLF